MSPPSFPPAVPCPGIPFPPRGPLDRFPRFAGTTGMLGRPAIPRASLRFLRSALPPCARFFLLSRRRGAPRCRAGVCHGVPLPDRSVEMVGPPRFLGDLRAHALLSDPDGTGTPSHYGVSMLPSAILEHVGSRHSLFRGSITRPAHSLSTLRSQGLPWTTQDSLPAGGWPWPDGSGYPQGPW